MRAFLVLAAAACALAACASQPAQLKLAASGCILDDARTEPGRILPGSAAFGERSQENWARNAETRRYRDRVQQQRFNAATPSAETSASGG